MVDNVIRIVDVYGDNITRENTIDIISRTVDIFGDYLIGGDKVGNISKRYIE